MVASRVALQDGLDLDPLEAAARVRRVRYSLFGQSLGERIAQARARYGRVYTRAELRAAAYPGPQAASSRFGRRLVAPLETCRAPIPDDALLRYADAAETTWFSRFCVVAPARSDGERPARWIVGELRGGADLYAIVARWHTQPGPTGLGRTPHSQTRQGERS